MRWWMQRRPKRTMMWMKRRSKRQRGSISAPSRMTIPPSMAIYRWTIRMTTCSDSLQRNHKAELLKLLLKRYNVECLGLQETCINWSKFKASQTVASILRDGKTPIRSVQSYNRYETDNIGYTQRGGTATVLRDELDGYFKDLGKDETGLGMWSWYRIQGVPGCRTRIVSAYAPASSKDSELASYYMQIKWYILRKGLRTTPKALFRDKLCKELKHWRSLGI